MKPSLSAGPTVLLAAVLLGAAFLPASAAEVVLYNGESASASGITLGGWGGGLAEYTTEERQDSRGSIRVKVRDLYQGARIDFQTPRDLGPVLRQPNAYLAVTLKLGTGTVTVPAAGAGGMPGMMGGGMPGMMGPGGMPGGAGGTVQLPRISKLRAMLVGDRGAAESYSLNEIPAAATGWFTVGIPLDGAALKASANRFLLRRLVLGADSPDTIHVSRIVVLNDDTEITADVSASKQNEIRAGEERVVFTAVPRGGVTPLKVTWDFDASDGIQEEATGERVEHTFPKTAEPKRYTVTCTVKPADSSKKKPYVETLEVEVVP